MPVIFEYDVEKNLLYETGIDYLSMKDFPDYKEMFSSIEFHPGVRIIADYRRAHTDFDFSEMYQIASFDRKILSPLGRIKMAILVTGKLGYGVARMYQSMLQGQNIQIELFRHQAAAEKWIGHETFCNTDDSVPDFSATSLAME
ncbi:MAG: hypothetical protein JXR78_06590 [Victivallales bacterium]|nr:hypothetical protein [Victivallales bacterium]